MPELPEVEIIKQSLDRKIRGKRIENISIKNRKLRFPIPSSFEKMINKKIINKVDRFSKYLLIIFKDNTICMIHLGMSGTIHLIKKNQINNFTNTSFYSSSILPKKHNHVKIHFNNLQLIYNDPRRFGYFKFFKNNNEVLKQFSHFGPEPFSKKFNTKYIFHFLKNKEKNIKNFLLDQSFVSGIGNIYACEILFHCKINPFRKAKTLLINDYKNLLYYSKKVLVEAIKKGGSSIRDFKNIRGNKGSFQKNFYVYQRENSNCLKKNCNGTIKKKNISNRSTFFCNICQK